MSYNIDYVNNVKYGADDINKMRTYFLSDGVIKKGPTDLLVTLNGNTININPGEALFYDGCRIEITDSEELVYNVENCYVYLSRNYYSSPGIESGSALPNNAIPLAQIENGITTDIRKYASMKIPSMGKNKYSTKSIYPNFKVITGNILEYTIDFEDRAELTYILFRCNFGNKNVRIFVNLLERYAFGISENARIVGPIFDNVWVSELESYIKLTHIGNKLKVRIDCRNYSDLGECQITAL
ncbi:MAG: hypothetical protein PHE51_10385 [Eubacteriales bacterium]|nr:hypothetical protein [Eubacteriales bacterium]